MYKTNCHILCRKPLPLIWTWKRVHNHRVLTMRFGDCIKSLLVDILFHCRSCISSICSILIFMRKIIQLRYCSLISCYLQVAYYFPLGQDWGNFCQRSLKKKEINLKNSYIAFTKLYWHFQILLLTEWGNRSDYNISMLYYCSTLVWIWQGRSQMKIHTKL